tara:strand:- start:19344 stop:20399 length:1056 start_codon:yes stop_codon:yes gene_type:complete
LKEMKKIIISKDIKLIQAMKKLALTGLRCLIVVDKKKKLLGTLTDGDIRRAIINGRKLTQNIESIYNNKPNFLVKGSFSLSAAKNLLTSKNHILIPVVNTKHCIVDYLNWEKVFGKEKTEKNLSKIPVIIMAGGKGTRLKPFTEILPKPLIPVGDKPVIEHIIDKFSSYGIKNFYISTVYKSRILKSYFYDLKPNYNINFLNEDKPLGTIGGIEKFKKNFKTSTIITNCDIIINSDISQILEFHKNYKNDITLVVSTKSHEVPYGVCELDDKGKFLNIFEKPKNFYLANTGFYIIEPSVLKFIPKNKFFHMTDLIKVLKNKKKKIGVFPIDESHWLDIGQWPDYNKNYKKI